MNIVEYNSRAWDKNVENSNPWSIPVSREAIARARTGDWEIVLTPKKAVPRDWFGEIAGQSVLCLASGGGQQAPILAAAGANVTVFDASPKQLAVDHMVAERDNLKIEIEQGDAADLSRFADEKFDLIVNPCSTCFMENVLPVWNECYRVLKPGGALLTGFNQPFVYVFDFQAEEEGRLEIKYKLPFSDVDSLSENEKQARIAAGEALEWSHSLDAQIGGQLQAGFLIAGFYEDWWVDEARLLNRYAPTFIATRAIKL